ncbi:hypothetical protein [Mesorhizobium sp. M7A.F.Ca.US.011.01.1.1]|uniref:hypothetical protein n=1 Tax=Mesorhizobium sp. M7A.F.Ca.US.011.01.1.1 TaxID=2496741 RepID=UPI001FE1D4A9|nr:hypothetical protein [Mesorhizobium sp. M7A.F.Ca.US.011.01.1.1]
MMASLALKIPSHQAELDLRQADDVHVNDSARIMRAADDTIELASMTFGFPTGGMNLADIIVQRQDYATFINKVLSVAKYACRFPYVLSTVLERQPVSIARQR